MTIFININLKVSEQVFFVKKRHEGQIVNQTAFEAR